MKFNRNNIFSILSLLAIACVAFSCTYDDINFGLSGGTSGTAESVRNEGECYKNVFLLYSAGYNNLSPDFGEDVDDLLSNYIPSSRREAILIFSHRTKSYGDYTTKTSPVLFRALCDTEGKVTCDTLLVMEPGTPSVSKETLNEVLTYVKDRFPSEHYGLMFSSHSSGWLPPKFKFNTSWKIARHGENTETDEYDPHGPRQDGLPEVRSIGSEWAKPEGDREIDIRDFADAIPMHLDYIIFDTCLMGCVEVAYELRNKCNEIVFSPAEILAEGMDYTTVISYLINDSGRDLAGFAENYYNFYNDPYRSHSYRSGTITLIDCTRIEQLAQTCKDIFSAHREEISLLYTKTNSVQRYYTISSHKCFYDLEDIITNCKASAEELAALRNSLDLCIPYCAATDYILGDINVITYSGLSMYLPLPSEPGLNSYYMTLEWNKATSLVE